eukprot:scaffold27248_cov133-Isochrysis_galbana.AAC.15
MSESRSMRQLQAASIVDRARCCAHNMQYAIRRADCRLLRHETRRNTTQRAPYAISGTRN